MSKRVRRKLQQMTQELMKRRHDSVADRGRRLRSVVQGYSAYFAVPGTSEVLSAFRKEVCKHWLRALRRRSHKARKLTWKRMERLIDTWIPRVRILHPYPYERLVV